MQAAEDHFRADEPQAPIDELESDRETWKGVTRLNNVEDVVRLRSPLLHQSLSAV